MGKNRTEMKPLRIRGKEMYPLIFTDSKRTADKYAASHRKFRRKMGYQSGTAVVKVGSKNYGVFSALCRMKPKRGRG